MTEKSQQILHPYIQASISSTLGKAMEFVSLKHSGQTDKSGQPYISHLLRVTARVSDDPIAMIVALLHDVVEDTDATLEEIGKMFGPKIMMLVDGVTHRKGEKYVDYIIRAASHPISKRVKIADIIDNMDPTRAAFNTPEIQSLQKRYRIALEYLNKPKECCPNGGVHDYYASSRCGCHCHEV